MAGNCRLELCWVLVPVRFGAGPRHGIFSTRVLSLSIGRMRRRGAKRVFITLPQCSDRSRARKIRVSVRWISVLDTNSVPLAVRKIPGDATLYNRDRMIRGVAAPASSGERRPRVMKVQQHVGKPRVETQKNQHGLIAGGVERADTNGGNEERISRRTGQPLAKRHGVSTLSRPARNSHGRHVGAHRHPRVCVAVLRRVDRAPVTA